jgi:hypothetical protein
LNAVLKWVGNAAGSGHKIKIMSYRFLTHKHLSKLPPLCPFCLAVSLWFLKIAVSKYDANYRVKFNIYPFVAHTGFNIEHARYEPIVYLDGNYSTVEARFRKWFYWHRLIIDFREIYNFSIWYKNNTYEFRDNILQLYDRRYISDTPDLYKYYLINNKGRILAFYNDSNPLSLISFEATHFSNNDCLHFCGHLNEGIEPEAQIHFNPMHCHVTLDEFKALHKEIEAYLYSMRDYCKGSEPVYIH